MKSKALDIDEYIAQFPPDVQKRLTETRDLIQTAAPKAEEIISYGIPTYKQDGILVYFGGYAKHIGFYPTPSAIVEFADELAGYKGAKGSVQFPHDKPLPKSLIKRIVKFKIGENKAAAKNRRK